MKMDMVDVVSLNVEETTKQCLIKAGYYQDIEQLLTTITKAVEDKIPNELINKFDIRYIALSRKVKLIIQRNNKNFQIRFPPILQAILGFEDGFISQTKIANRAADLSAAVHSMYIYSNIATPRIVGDSLVPLLRVVPVHGTHNEYVMESFYHLQYVPV